MSDKDLSEVEIDCVIAVGDLEVPLLRIQDLTTLWGDTESLGVEQLLNRRRPDGQPGDVDRNVLAELLTAGKCNAGCVCRAGRRIPVQVVRNRVAEPVQIRVGRRQRTAAGIDSVDHRFGRGGCFLHRGGYIEGHALADPDLADVPEPRDIIVGPIAAGADKGEAVWQHIFHLNTGGIDAAGMADSQRKGNALPECRCCVRNGLSQFQVSCWSQAVDGHSHRGNIGGLTIGECVAEAVRCGFAHSQRLKLAVGVIVEGAITVVGHLPKGAGGVECGDSQGIAINIGVVGQHVDDDCDLLIGGRCIISSHRSVVDRGHCDRDRGCVGAFVAVVNGVAEAIGAVELCVGCVLEGAIAIEVQRAVRHVRVDGNGQRVPVDVAVSSHAVVAEHVAADGSVFGS